MSEFLEFVEVQATGKTHRWSVRNRKSSTELGVIKWYGAWRQYCYFPTIQAVYSAGCLEDIAKCMQEARDAWHGEAR